jgi:hypothetical protein
MYAILFTVFFGLGIALGSIVWRETSAELRGEERILSLRWRTFLTGLPFVKYRHKLALLWTCAVWLVILAIDMCAIPFVEVIDSTNVLMGQGSGAIVDIVLRRHQVSVTGSNLFRIPSKTTYYATLDTNAGDSVQLSVSKDAVRVSNPQSGETQVSPGPFQKSDVEHLFNLGRLDTQSDDAKAEINALYYILSGSLSGHAGPYVGTAPAAVSYMSSPVIVKTVPSIWAILFATGLSALTWAIGLLRIRTANSKGRGRG